MKLSQTQRNYMSKQLVRQAKDELKTYVKKMTPKFIADRGSHFCDPEIGQYDISSPIRVAVHLSYHYSWVKRDICSNKKEIIKDMMETTQLPSSWYVEQWDNDQVEVDIARPEDMTCGDKATGRPKINITFPNEQKALKALRAKDRRKCETAIQQAVEAYQFIHERAVDLEKFLNNAHQQIMLSDTKGANGLFEELKAELKSL